MAEEKSPPFHCSFMDTDAGGIPCSNAAKWACRIDAGPWMLGWWGCDDHKPYLEGLLPIISPSTGGFKTVPVIAMLTRSPLILSIDYLVTGQQGQPIMTKLTCDKCGKPITRHDNRWIHVVTSLPDMDIINHEALPG